MQVIMQSKCNLLALKMFMLPYKMRADLQWPKQIILFYCNTLLYDFVGSRL